jgi:hypothetical protein
MREVWDRPHQDIQLINDVSETFFWRTASGSWARIPKRRGLIWVGAGLISESEACCRLKRGSHIYRETNRSPPPYPVNERMKIAFHCARRLTFSLKESWTEK